MEYVIYKMEFHTGVHIGNTSLEDSELTIHADTVFSALCLQALALGGQKMLNNLYESVSRGELVFSDAFPYDSKNCYIPKPLMAVSHEEDGSSAEKKQFKKMKYIPLTGIKDFVEGRIAAKEINDLIKAHGTSELRTHAKVDVVADTEPFHVGVYYFKQGNGLYLIAGHENADSKALFNELLNAVSFAGIGGERSSGLGRFTLKAETVGADLKAHFTEDCSKYVALSVCLPADEDLEKVIDGASFALLRRGGFVASENYAPEWRRKKDLYVFQPGSVFTEKFEGTIFDVSSGGSHPVYKYAKPVWLGVKS